MANIKRVNSRNRNFQNMKTFSWLLTCFISIAVAAQDKLIIKGKSPDQYVVYVANGGESLQSISNGFGLSVPKISSYNKINISTTKNLPKGTAIKIPLTKDNLLQRNAANSEPVVHVIGKGDNLYRVSQLYHKVPVASLREWNHLTKDVVKNGQQIIVGYMVNAKPVITTEKKAETKKADPPKEIITTIQTPVPAPEKNIEEKKITTAAPVKNETPVVTASPPVVTNEAATAIPKVAEKKEIVNMAYMPKEGDEGYFALAYADHTPEQKQQFQSGDASIFKTISGWTDRKFYVLMNDIAPKTIIRITGTANKSICAMVLGPLQETKGAGGLLLRMSNSAASALGLTGDKFTITVTYFQ